MEEAESGIEEIRNHPVYIHIQNELMKCWAKILKNSYIEQLEKHGEERQYQTKGKWI